MSSPTTRVLTVLELLQSHARMTGTELAARVDVDVRTIRRYIDALQELGIPVLAERGRYGAYSLMPGFKLPPLMFSEDEALALTLGLLVARRVGMLQTVPALESALAKVERVLPVALRQRIQAVQQALLVELAEPDAAPANATVLAFSTAIRNGHQVALRYRSAGQQATERLIEPYGVVYRGGRWYAPAYCHLRAGMRLFRLDRVLAAEVVEDAAFTRPADFDTLGFVRDALAAAPGAWAVRVLIEAPLERVRRAVEPEAATLLPQPDGVELRLHVEDLDWMARFLVEIGEPFVVREPPELRDAVRALAAALLRDAARESPAKNARASALDGSRAQGMEMSSG